VPASTFNQVTVSAPAGSAAPATQLVESSGVDVLVFNTSTTVTAFLSAVNSALSSDAGTPVVSPLGPQQSIVFNGELDVFAVVAPNQVAVLNLYPSATNYTPFVSVTTLFQAGSVAGGSNINIAAGATTILLNMADISLYASYDLSLALSNFNQNTHGSALCCRVTLSWFDDLISGVPVFQEIWNPWVVTAIPGVPPQGIIGNGPMHGKYFSISITNPGVNVVGVVYANIFGSPRQVPLSDWRQFLNNAVLDNVLVNLFNTAIDFDNDLADTQGPANLLANTSYLMPFGLYAGPVTYSLQLGAGIVVTRLNIIDIGGNYNVSTSGNVNPAVGNLLSPGTAAGEQLEGQLFLPRSGCALYVAVTTTGGTINFKVTAQQGP
jgi:hypothetical protein